MENDQIKTQIENAKRAFVASKARDRDLSADAATRNRPVFSLKLTDRQTLPKVTTRLTASLRNILWGVSES